MNYWFLSKYILWLGFANICATNGLVPNRYSGCLLQIYWQLMVLCQIFIVAVFVNILATNGLMQNIYGCHLLQTCLQQMVCVKYISWFSFATYGLLANMYFFLSKVYLTLRGLASLHEIAMTKGNRLCRWD